MHGCMQRKADGVRCCVSILDDLQGPSGTRWLWHIRAAYSLRGFLDHGGDFTPGAFRKPCGFPNLGPAEESAFKGLGERLPNEV